MHGPIFYIVIYYINCSDESSGFISVTELKMIAWLLNKCYLHIVGYYRSLIVIV